ncbi:regulator of microtubule dynamics protein 1 isoform X1 [Oryzias melastigma]|uniref:regulator of microtubule dynamics protein 1 isoform X1 n=1 Tax=Oryzias melastigma TaxID=30732 RepID=UPI00168D831B|nr:regulator of microtubule dynamics protein 1 isoform X1 [Oryzias melastigma]
MSGKFFSRMGSTLLKMNSAAKRTGMRGTSRLYWTTIRRIADSLNNGRAALLLGLPVLSALSYEAGCRFHVSALVCALEKDEILEQADYLYSCAETEKLYELLVKYKDSDEAEFLWRLARASRELSLLPDTDPQRKTQLTFEAFEFAKKALERDDANFAVHKWYAICLSDIGDCQGVKAKIGNSFLIREHLEVRWFRSELCRDTDTFLDCDDFFFVFISQKAIQLNPKDATSMHILGYWCFAFAELPWYQRKVAAVIFATPPTSTFEEALEFFLKAEEVDPNFYSKNLLMLGKTYMAMKDGQNALLWLTKAKEYPAHTLEDKQVLKEAEELLKKLG